MCTNLRCMGDVCVYVCVCVCVSLTQQSYRVCSEDERSKP